jgi:hypothetical protein
MTVIFTVRAQGGVVLAADWAVSITDETGEYALPPEPGSQNHPLSLEKRQGARARWNGDNIGWRTKVA